jgi:hypothetical protein
MAERFDTGKAGSIHVDGAEIKVTGWNASDECDWQETTHTGSGGYHEDIPGTLKMTGSFNASLDLDDVPVPNLAAGVIVALQLDYETSNPAITLAKAGVDSFEVTSESKGVISFTCNFHSIGTYAWA